VLVVLSCAVSHLDAFIHKGVVVFTPRHTHQRERVPGSGGRATRKSEGRGHDTPPHNLLLESKARTVHIHSSLCTMPPHLHDSPSSGRNHFGGHNIGGRMLAPTFRPPNTLGGGMPSRPSPCYICARDNKYSIRCKTPVDPARAHVQAETLCRALEPLLSISQSVPNR